MQLDVIQRRAEIINNGGKSTDKLNDEFRLFPSMNFTCSGQITGLLLGADIRWSTNYRNQYPMVQIWRNTVGDIDAYTRQASQEIRLAEGNFSPNGVLQYNLTTPISFQSGDVLGVYQPGSGSAVVRLYYNRDNNAPDSYQFQAKGNPSTENQIALQNTSRKLSQLLLLSPITGKKHTF